MSKGLTGLHALAITADGNFVYAAAGTQTNTDEPGYGAISVLKRDTSTGGLTEVSCTSSDGSDGRDGAVGSCGTSTGLLDADAIAVSPDGNDVYAASDQSGSIIGFSRDSSTGKLTELGCFQELVPPGSHCYGARVFRGSSSVAVSPDNGAVYVGSGRRDVISELLASEAPPNASGAAPTSAASVFKTPPQNGWLADPCIATAGLDGACDYGVSERGVASLAVSPDGRNVYATASRSGAVDVFTRDTSGKLSETGCLMPRAPSGLCHRSSLLSSPGAMAVSADGRNLYVVDESRLVILRRDPAAGALSEVGCVDELAHPESPGSGSGSGSASSARLHRAQNDPCQSVPGLDSITAVAISPSGSTVYTAGDGALAEFSRNATNGKLTETGCDVPTDDRCSSIPQLTGVEDAVVSPDGRNLYLASNGENGVFAFGHGASAASARARVRGSAATVTLQCPASMRAACTGRLRLVGTTRPRRGQRGRWPLSAAAAPGATHFRLRPGQRRRYRLTVPANLLRQLRLKRDARVLAVAVPDPGGGGALARVVILSG